MSCGAGYFSGWRMCRGVMCQRAGQRAGRGIRVCRRLLTTLLCACLCAACRVQALLRALQPRLAAGGKRLATLPQGDRGLQVTGAGLQLAHDLLQLGTRLFVAEGFDGCAQLGAVEANVLAH